MPNIKIEDISSVKKKISITVPQEQVDGYYQRAYQKVGGKAKIKGFRPGKIPTNILDQHYGAEIQYECLNFLISDSYVKALQDNKLIPMTDPAFDTKPIEKGKEYQYFVEVEIKPEIKLGDYKGIKVKKQEAKIAKKDLEEELNRLQESLAQLAPAKDDAVLEKGLVATIDFDGTMDGKTFDGGSAKDYVFEFGKGQLLQDFETNMEKMKKGDSKEFSITFPKDYFSKELAGKKADYKLTLKDIHNKNLPKIDDEMAKDIGKENLEQVKTELEKSLQARKEREFRKDYADTIRKELLKKHKFDVPESIVDKEAERSKRDKKEVEEQLRLELILEDIAIKENIKATPQDVDARMKMLAQMYRQPIDEIKKLYSKNNMVSSLAAQIALDKTMDFLVDNANFS